MLLNTVSSTITVTTSLVDMGLLGLFFDVKKFPGTTCVKNASNFASKCSPMEDNDGGQPSFFFWDFHCLCLVKKLWFSYFIPKKGNESYSQKKVRTCFCWKKQSLLVVVGRSISMSKSQERSIQSFGPWQRSLLYCWRTGMSDDWHRLPPPATVIYPSYLVNLSRGLPKNFCQDCKSIRNFSGLFNANVIVICNYVHIHLFRS